MYVHSQKDMTKFFTLWIFFLINYKYLQTEVDEKVLPKVTFECLHSVQYTSRTLMQLQMEEKIVGVERAKVKTRGKLNVTSVFWSLVTSVKPSWFFTHAMFKMNWTGIQLHKQSACKHNEKHSIAWCSESSNAWWFSFWFFLNFIIYTRLSFQVFVLVSSKLKKYYYFLGMSRSEMTFFKKYEEQRLKKS